MLALAVSAGCRPEVRPGQESLLRAAWKRRFAGEIVAVGLSGAGTLAVAATAQGPKGRGDDRIVAIDRKGTILWQQILDRKVVGLVVSVEGTLVAVSLADGTLRAWNADGDSLWQVPCGGTAKLSASGDLIACHGEGGDIGTDEAIEVLDARGRHRWKFDDPAGMWDLGVPDAGDGVLGLTQAGKLVALDGSGRVAWTRDLGPVLGAVRLSPGDGGVVVVGTGIEGEKLLAFDRAGTPLWTAAVPGGGESIAVSRGGAFVAAANNTTLGQRISVYDGRGRLFWNFHLDRPAQEPVRVGISESGDRVFASIERAGRPEIAIWDGHGEPAGRARFGSEITAFDVSRDGRGLLVAARGGKMFFYDLR
jgi:DNA-binding beta-propeller fold protein YncE